MRWLHCEIQLQFPRHVVHLTETEQKRLYRRSGQRALLVELHIIRRKGEVCVSIEIEILPVVDLLLALVNPPGSQLWVLHNNGNCPRRDRRFGGFDHFWEIWHNGVHLTTTAVVSNENRMLSIYILKHVLEGSCCHLLGLRQTLLYGQECRTQTQHIFHKFNVTET